eukprot:4016201-Prymnesium_polylepis.1
MAEAPSVSLAPHPSASASGLPLRLRSQPLPRRVPRPCRLQIPLRHAPPICPETGPHQNLSSRPRH